MAELMARSGSSFQVLTKGQIVEGTIKKLQPGEIIMDIGGKGDALVIEFDRQNIENLMAFLKVGDVVKASVISVESEEGFPVLSLRRTLDDIIFQKFDDLAKNEEPFEINILEAGRGGYFAETLEGMKGFLPSSQVTDQDNLVGKRIKVKLLEADRTKRRIVFSQKAISFVTSVDAMKKYIKAGDVVEAEISSVTSYGIFVVVTVDKDKKIEGFVHISEIAYERVEDLVSKFKAGEKISVQVIDLDAANRRVNLSIKRTLKDTFATVREKYKTEDKVKGTVTDVKTRGITLKIDEGINGFISADKIPAGTTYEVGKEVTAEIVGIDDRRRVILLSPVLKSVPIGYR